jgi:ubiquitin carboxyl-terminal hydrolase 7
MVKCAIPVSNKLIDYLFLLDIQLNVKGMKNLHDSFKDYVAVETLDGENKYHAEGYGLQDAKKGIIFESFPPVLHLQLKRFEYDIQRDAMVKINDRHEFPFEIDLSEFLDPAADRSQPWIYKLHGVLVHSGDLHGGHYFALIKPDAESRWLKFDDDRVTPVTDKEVLEENYGGEAINGLPPALQRNQVRAMKRFTNAYMLVYIRESALIDVLPPFTEEDTPPHLSVWTYCISSLVTEHYIQSVASTKSAYNWKPRRGRERNNTSFLLLRSVQLFLRICGL